MPGFDPFPSSPRGRRRLPVLSVVAGGVVLLVFLLVAALHTPPAKRFVLSQVTSLLADSQIAFTARRVDYNLLNLSLVLQDVTLRAVGADDLPAFAHLDRATVDMSLLALLRGRYVVERGTVTHPTVHVVLDEGDRSNLPQLPQRDDAGERAEPIEYLIRRVSISDAQLRFEDRRQGLDIRLPVNSIEVQGQQVSQHRVRLTAGGGQVRLLDRQADIERVSGELVIDRDAIRVEQLDLGATGTSVTLSGTMVQLDDPRYDIALAANFDVTQLAVLAGIPDPAGGSVRAEVTARGPLGTLTAEARVSGTDLSFRDLEGVQLVAQMSYVRVAQQARLARLEVTGAVGSIDAQGIIALNTDAGASQFDADVAALDLDMLMRALAMPYVAATSARGRIIAQWPGLEYERADFDAQLTLTPTRTTPSRNILPVGGSLVATARDQRVVLDIQELRALGAALGGRVTLADRRVLGGSVRLGASDIAQVVPEVESFLGRPRATLVGTPVAGEVRLDARVGGIITAPSVAATASAPALAIGGLSGVSLDANAQYSPAAVTLRELDVAWQEARLEASGRVSLQGRQSVAIDATLARADIAALLAALDRADIPAEGVVSLQANAAGTLANPRATLSMQAADVAAYGEIVGTLTADAELVDRDVRLRKLQLIKPQPDGDGTLTANGSYHLDRRTLNLQLESEQLRLLNLMLPDGVPVRAALQVEAGAHGTLEDPTGTARLVVEELRVRDDDLGRVTVDANVAGQQAHVQARAEKFRIDADAQLGTLEPYQTNVRVLVDDLDLASLPVELNPPLTGRVRARLDGHGSLSSPADGTATTTIEEMIVTWNGQPIATEGPATIRVREPSVRTRSLRRTCAGLDGGRARNAACGSAIGRGRGRSRRAIEPLDACFLRTGTVPASRRKVAPPSRARSEVPCARSIPISSFRSNRDL